ncbi:MAG: SPFH domain-containing protein [Acidobacteriota bacterium]|nr:SPFH domain-containing protein [Acidobacteriota bacterium]MDQ7088051.1 SPFH domain-containing protein [Acidobacteriota bacterium]
MLRETIRNGLPGVPVLVLGIIALTAAVLGMLRMILIQAVPGIIAGGVLIVLVVFLLAGLFMVAPNEGKVLQLFGDYRGTAREPGLRWANPFYAKKTISLRVRNFETGKLKVNDSRGNPVEIAAIVVWRVVDTAEAAFQVDDYENYVRVQSEAALRNMATGYPYDAHEEGEVALASHTAEISRRICEETQARLEKAGVQIIEARISHLAYAAEIASAMLRRQQATAVVAARQKIVEGAVGMVEQALELLAERHVLELDEERKAAMVSNLLVVLCAETEAQPVVNTGSLYT